MIDTHSHPYMNNKKPQAKIIEDFFCESGEAMVVIGTDLKTSKEAIKTAKNNEKIFATIGIHPCDIEKLDLMETIKSLENLYLENKEKIVGIGEIGLDYYWIEVDAEKLFSNCHSELDSESLNNKEAYIKNRKELQKVFFKAQILLAETYSLPFIIHNRDASEDVLEILKEINYKNFIFHSYSEDYNYAKKVLDFAPECFFSFSGIVTFKNALGVQETAKNIADKNILAETDCPFLTPTPFRGKEENEPKYVKYIIEKISDLRGKDMSKIIENNSKRAFGI